MNLKTSKRLRFLVLGLITLFMLATTTVAFAWWDRLEQETGEQSLDMGYGVRLVLNDETSENQGVLVPAGSFYAAVDGYATEYVFTYELNLEEDLDTFDLLIDISNLTIGGVAYDQAPNVHGPLSVVIASEDGSFESDGYDTDITGPNTSLRMNEVLQGDGTIVITITFTLQDHVEDAAFAGDLVEAYAALAGQEITFDVAFEIPVQTTQSNLYEQFLTKSSIFNVGAPPYESYNVDSWNGYLEKLFEVGRSDEVTRLSSASPQYGKNVLGIENSFGEPGNNQLVLNMINTGVFNYLRNNMPYQEQLPLAILLTNHIRFEHNHNNNFITNNLDVLAGTLVIYKNNQWDNSAVQVYTILENGQRSELLDIQDLFDLIP